jgi:glycine oxidase
MPDVIVVGGGVIGLSIAYELALQGLSVALLEQGSLGAEASWAGAGMLPPGNLAGAQSPEARLRAASHALWPDWSRRLREETGIDNGYLRCGGLTVSLSPTDRDFADSFSAWRHEGVDLERLSRADLAERFPSLSNDVAEAFLLPDMAQVRNPRHLKALVAGCARRGVELLPGHPVVGVERAGETILALRTPQQDFRAGEFVFAAGAWSASLLQSAGVEFPVEPVRGQIVLLQMGWLPFRTIIELGKRYLVPRPDGRILIGSTEERVGFVKANTAEAVADLLRFATGLVPDLQQAHVERMWSGLRPHRPGELPYLGRVAGLKNACLAAGHFRAGLQMSPITAVLIRQVLLGEPVTLPEECVFRPTHSGVMP